MAMSKCIKCDSTHFELVVKDGISGSKYKICFIQCSNCGGVVGTMDYMSIGAALDKIAAKIGVRL